VREVQTTHRCRRCHGTRFGESHTRAVRAEQRKQLRLFTVIRTGRIAERRTNAAISLVHEVIAGEALVRAVAPVLARACVQVFRKRFGEPIGERLHHDGVIVVVIGFVPPHELVRAESSGYRKGAKVIDDPALGRRNEVGQRAIRLAISDRLLLPQHVESNQGIGP
jgi:hypothetical protein